METRLRPMSLGEILDLTAQLYRSNFLLFCGIASVYAGAILLMELAHIGLQQLFLALHWTAQVGALNIGALLVQWLVMFLIGGLAVAANNRAVSWVHLGQRATIRGAYASVLPQLGRVLWLMTIIAFVLWTPLALCYGGFLSATLVWYKPLLKSGSVQHNPQAAMLFAMLGLAFFVAASAAILYAALMGLRYALAVPACVVEKIKARAALKRSIYLSQGSRGRIFVLGLLIVAIQLALVGITQAFFIVLAFRSHMTLPVWARVTQQIVAFLTNSFIGPMYATGLTLFYYDQRVRKEGFDIEWMMQAAGLATSTAPAAEVAQTSEPPLEDEILPEARE